jgi:hypothetical protein
MGTNDNHRKLAEQCIAMARAAEGDRDKALWLTLAQSWVRLAEHVARTKLSRHTPRRAALNVSTFFRRKTVIRRDLRLALLEG